MNEKNEPVNFEVIYQVTDRFIDTFSFLNVSRDDNEHIYLQLMTRQEMVCLMIAVIIR